MLTIKHITNENSPNEQEEIVCAPHGCFFKNGHLWVYRNRQEPGCGTEVYAIWGGRAYVMNDAGQTIAHYTLKPQDENLTQTFAGLPDHHQPC